MFKSLVTTSAYLFTLSDALNAIPTPAFLIIPISTIPSPTAIESLTDIPNFLQRFVSVYSLQIE